MRYGCLVAALLLLVAGSARAGTLTSATWITDVGLGPILPVPPLSIPITASGTSTATSIAVSLAVPQFTTGIFFPSVMAAAGTINAHVAVTLAGAQALTATAGMAGATGPVPGTVLIMTAIHDAMGVNQSMFKVGANTLVEVPLSVGNAGQFTNTFTVLGVFHVLTVDFAGWTPGTVVFTGQTSALSPLPDLTITGSFALTAMGGGTVTLVSPSRISIDGDNPDFAQRRSVGYTTLRLSFVPEPSSLLLLSAAAVAGLALVSQGRAH